MTNTKRTSVRALLWTAAGFFLFGKTVSPSHPAPLQRSAALQIKGSDTMVNLGQAWAEAFVKKHPETNVAVTGGGSGTGIAALISGNCDLAESSRALEEKEIQQAKAKGLVIRQEVVALDGIVVVVHPSNPVGRLTMEELREIFLGEIKSWKTVGGPNWPIVLLSREVNSGTHIFFKEHVLRRGKSKGPEEFAPAALMMPSSYAIAEEVAHNENAVGYYGLGYISPRQKVVAVARDGTSPFTVPDIETVRTNSYPISRPLYLFTRGEPSGPVKAFLDFALSPEGQKIVVETDFVPVR
ncbi:MAG: phosphate ABC transporter substrate-binding protein [Candidatus Aminicenantes bacterium]|nr:phosphate ABC transporter substrate-binding protein [Candidatus Aminicenantes bacterium]